MSTHPYTDDSHPATAIRTASGRLVDLADFRPEDALLSDIATSLAHQERYTGHCPLRPTVAQHSLAVEHIALYLMPDEMGEPSDFAAQRGVEDQLSRAALMHDAAEAYVSDLSAPAKRALRLRQWQDWPAQRRSAFDLMEHRVTVAISHHFDCWNTGWAGLIHEADVLAWAYESAYAGWSPSAVVPAWLARDLYVARCYRAPNQMPGGMPYKDGGEAAFLRRAAALGMRDA